MKCFLDLDGVLVDFIGGACRLLNSPNPWLKDEYKGRWGAEEMFGVSANAFWKNMGEDFWANLEWTKEGKDILSLAEAVFGYDNIGILTTPCLTKGSVSGKMDWINANMPSYKKKVMVGFQKHFCAHPGSILLDDADKNVEQFRASGGNAILIPRQWNKQYYWEQCLFEALSRKLEVYNKEAVLEWWHNFTQRSSFSESKSVW